MRKLRFMVIFLALGLAACGSDPQDGPPPTATLPGLPTTAATTAPPTATIPPADYPGPEATPAGYPGDEAAADNADPYPADTDTIWIIQPFGAQCGNPDDLLFGGDVDLAVASLLEAGVTVFQASVSNLIVCSACDTCPTSEHFRALIGVEGLDTAVSLGWLAEEG